MRRMLYCFFLLLLFSLAIPAYCFSILADPEILLSQYVKTDYSEQVSNEILDICQDKEGYIWLATYGGLIRYDGSDFFSVNNGLTENNIGALSVRTLLPDTDGALWVGTNENGLAKYDNGKISFMSSAQFKTGDSVRNLAKDSQGRL